MPTAQWSADKREEVLALLRGQIGTREVARRTGVPVQTVSRWAKAAGLEAVNAEQVAAATDATRIAWAQRKAQLVDDLGEVAAELLSKARDAAGREAQAYMTAVAIGVDKAQLLSGGVTSRHEQLDAQRRRERVVGLGDELEARRAAKDGTTGG